MVGDVVIRILLVEQMNLLRGALVTALSTEPDLHIVADVGGIDECVAIGRAVRPDVAIVNIDLLGAAGSCELSAALPDCAVLVLAETERLDTLRGALETVLDTDVCGVVGTDTAPADLADYIRRVARGERVIDPMLAVAAVATPRSPLTEREREVLRVAALGVPAVEIAQRLHLSVGTVHNYMSKIMKKAGGRNRLEAIRIAEESGWL
jgi:two-component system response regulator DesR